MWEIISYPDFVVPFFSGLLCFQIAISTFAFGSISNLSILVSLKTLLDSSFEDPVHHHLAFPY